MSGDGKQGTATAPVLVDAQGLLLQAIVPAADIQDRDGGVLVMATPFGLHPFLRKFYADGGYQGPQLQRGLRQVMRGMEVQIVKRSDAPAGFTVLPKQWTVERTIAWLNLSNDPVPEVACMRRRVAQSRIPHTAAARQVQHEAVTVGNDLEPLRPQRRA